ncbi:MAG: ParB N-terminal domain-containing protein [Halothiobacillaceae bacterium]
MATISIPINSIIADSAFQPRVTGLDLEHVRALEAAAEVWPPLKVVARGRHYLLLDGFHRFAAAQNLGLTEIAVEVLDIPADGDLLGLAFALNAVHGRPLTLSDRRAFAERLLRAHPDWADREIGRRAGLVQPTIGKIRQALEREAAIAPAESRIGRDGRSYPATVRAESDTNGEASSAGDRPSLLDAIAQAITPAERIAQREIVQYLKRLADSLEAQDGLAGFETIEDAAAACRAVLGAAGAEALAGQLGWSSRNIVLIAAALGDTGAV